MKIVVVSIRFIIMINIANHVISEYVCKSYFLSKVRCMLYSIHRLLSCVSYCIVYVCIVLYIYIYTVLVFTCCRYHEACIAIRNREDKVAAIAEQIETNLTLVGATAIEDKLQQVIVRPQANAARRLIVRNLLSRPYLYYEHLTYKVYSSMT